MLQKTQKNQRVIYLGLKELRAAFKEGKEARKTGIELEKKAIQARRINRARKAGARAAKLTTARGFVKDIKRSLPITLRKGKKRKTLLKHDVKLPKIF